ncbi:hypothetical protein SAMN05192583_1088 [Sphingomonas gellani]|uniref:Uncharacterized protein n=1 Tax=Sphingomonas gellani TaxID=1166340 RepID=A0A1H8AYN3_9SPHN|nr:hypothetical protein SAMN05192583_1088 [Sphingomonas gellani]
MLWKHYTGQMSGDFDDFIELDRTFRDLAISEEEADDAKMVRLFAREAPTGWAELLAEPRVIILAEAGSGKTEVIAKQPHVARTSNGERVSGYLRNFVGIVYARIAGAEQRFQFTAVEPRKGKIEVGFGSEDSTEFKLQEFLVSAGEFGKTVVGNDIRAPLCLRQMFKPQHRDTLQLQQPGCCHPPMPGDNRVRAIDKHRIGEAEALDAAANLLDLGLGVRTRITVVAAQRRNRRGFEFVG